MSNPRRPRRSRRFSSAVIATVTVSLLVAACGGSTTDTAPAAPAPADSGSTAAPEEAKPSVRVRISQHAAAPTIWGITADQMKEYLESESNGRFEVEVFHGGSLVGPVEILDAVGDGRVEIGLLLSGYHPAELPLMTIATVPLLGTNNSEVGMRAMNRLYRTNETYAQEFTDLGVFVIADSPLTDAVIAGPKRFETLEDFAGLRIRSLGYHASAISAVGGTPVAIQLPETYDALQRGVIDAMNSFTLSAMVGTGFYEISSNLQTLGWGLMGVQYWIAGSDWYASLDDELQAVIDGMQEYMVEVGIAAVEATDQSSCDKLIEVGHSVDLMDPAEVARWRELALDSIVSEWKTNTQRAKGYSDAVIFGFLNDYLEAIEEFEDNVAYADGMETCVARIAQGG